MVTISIDINTFEEALNLQNVSAIRHNALLEGDASRLTTSQTLISMMWKQIHLEAGNAMEKLQANSDDESDYQDEG
ncbi:hypothetical protein L3V77_07850 [Vibrio sp. DW001]|uniref:hypothetical protein n=1 Tax=Vibrio sp. DW001 TaxID=2912315 RepID=UPI0023B146B6|nr:hypothetical protein [Vibrio sp. DW001]WED28129.1 hypothetical protein L3V77_07850 [Vibrio sp. DW001]